MGRTNEKGWHMPNADDTTRKAAPAVTLNPPSVVRLRPMEAVANRCGMCAHFDATYDGQCQIVAGRIPADYTCDLFAIRRPNRGFLYPSPSSLLTSPLDIPTVRAATDAVFRGYIAEDTDGTILVRDLDVDPLYWDPGMMRRVKELLPGDTPWRLDMAKEAPHRYDLIVKDGFARLEESAGPTQHVMRMLEEKRYTLGPIYLPDTTDAHGEYVTRDDLQNATWGYVREAIATGSNAIYKQHTGERIGEWVEVVTWPVELTMKVTIPGEGTVERVFPAGTVFQGIVWDEAAWPDVKKGKIRGLSLGGYARKPKKDAP